MNMIVSSNNFSPVVQLDRITNFMLEKVTNPHAKPKAKSCALAHLTTEEGSGSAILNTHTFTATGDALVSQVQDIARIYENEARENAATHTSGRPQKYAVVLYAQADQVLARHDFLVAPPPGTANIGGETEPPTATGMVSFTMRHQEATMRMLISSIHDVHSRLADENDKVRARCESLENKHFEIIKTTEELLSKKAERDLMIAEKQANIGLRERALNRLEQIMPLILEQTGVLQLPKTASPPVEPGTPLPPAGPTSSVAEAIQSLHLSPEQLQTMAGTLTDEQFQRFYALMTEGKK